MSDSIVFGVRIMDIGGGSGSGVHRFHKVWDLAYGRGGVGGGRRALGLMEIWKGSKAIFIAF